MEGQVLSAYGVKSKGVKSKCIARAYSECLAQVPHRHINNICITPLGAAYKKCKGICTRGKSIIIQQPNATILTVKIIRQ